MYTDHAGHRCSCALIDECSPMQCTVSVSISATSMPTYQCLPICTSMPHISAHNATYQCPHLELKFHVTYQCQSEPPIECQSVPPISAANQCHLL
ncbi:unnamed protein product, partial [Staurois parvus]